MSTLLDAQGTVHAALLAKGENTRTLCTPTGIDDEHITRCGLTVDCPGCIAVDTAMNTFTGPRYEVFMNGSLMGGGSDFRSALASLVRVSLRYPERLFRLHSDVDSELVLLEFRNGVAVEITD